MAILIGVPVLNRVDLLERALATYDYPHELFVVNNNSVDADFNNAFDILQKRLNFDSRRPRFNLGCAASWNIILMQAMARGHQFCYIGSNDTLLKPGSLQAFAEMEMKPDEGLFLGKGMNFFCIRTSIVSKVGWFDENFYPAYFEDNDFVYRCNLAGVKIVRLGPRTSQFNGRTLPAVQMNHLRSQTVASDKEYAAHNRNTFGNWNRAHYVCKWGGTPGCEKFRTPYNREDKDLKWWPDPGKTIEKRDWDNGKRKRATQSEKPASA